ncbi:histone-lysine N-methyltransferase set-17-like [Saccostrea cucullata]|uniref:histone-lysine N-methyltransferase set-17-like n=1 Tax=Saccostrea cuccullata TaxID=36930 RepID=UPI002ED265BB
MLLPTLNNTDHILWFIILLTVSLSIDGGVAQCKRGFQRVVKWCISLHEVPMSAADSIKTCKEQGGRMLVLDSREKEYTITQYIQELDFFRKPESRETNLHSSLQEMNEIAEVSKKFCEEYRKFRRNVPSFTFIKKSKTRTESPASTHANKTTPESFYISLSGIPDAGLGVWSDIPIPKFTVLDEYEGIEYNIADACKIKARCNNYSWLYSWVVRSTDDIVYKIDATSPELGNWLRYVNCAAHTTQENVHGFPCEGLVFYMTTRDITPRTELFLWYGDSYGDYLNLKRIHPEKDMGDNVKIRVNVLSKQSDKMFYEDGTPMNYTRWVPGSTQGLPDGVFGLSLVFKEVEWKWHPEKDYSYFTGPEGLKLPFICEQMYKM